MKLLHQVLKKMYQDYAVVFPAVDPKDVQRASVALVKAGVPQIPTDYIEFLSSTNGLFWNGLELFSLFEHEREKGAFTHTGIMESYATYAQNPLLKKKLVVGVAPEELIVYYPEAKEYQIVDRHTQSILVKLPRFFDVLCFYARDLIGEEMEAEENE